MSSPLGHSLAGYVIFKYRFHKFEIRNLKKLLFCIVIANAPDLDFIPGILIGKPNIYHHGISHSLGAAILFSLALLFFTDYIVKVDIKAGFFFILGLYCFHLLLDYISTDGRPPLGIPIFWPLSNEYFIFPSPLLPPIMHSELDHANIAQFLDGILSIHNLHVLFLEMLIMVPFILSCHLIQQGGSKAD